MAKRKDQQAPSKTKQLMTLELTNLRQTQVIKDLELGKSQLWREVESLRAQLQTAIAERNKYWEQQQRYLEARQAIRELMKEGE